ncbi:chromosome segregation protein SMC [Laedolimicola ammoniilytica]|uniref:Chromosome partition protein Smc n=1 Tax=Laedolimicola ammoniilytica TaxID=2981771 RepID=A0ABT2RUV9_9FIRM|nr:chromosome segregation protein SMC [Laedolimicola ammoniilytica]MCU6696095.1 chromosome segregation protein SMC [Laedolimicola ammoniilytica]SCH44649.1 Chromosome partition protein Smc [uncultured Clostridium sp.]
MYLKSIEVQGFKSFANKIVFDFHNGITGIVGPNGSGKSNVADAVRWVLGEQRVKQLRGGTMQDVIFAGTENRRPLSYAYVAITLDNSDHQLSIDYEEVTVSRRLYRSGESEYLINGAACRLKDINELFYDTGIGKEGYSIIGQGQIDRILSSKPEESRELFDEATGIVKFKRRKNTAQKKLEDEKQNIVRINDILAELEKQLGPLEKQSAVAREYLKKKEALKLYDVNMFLLETGRVQRAITELETKIGDADRELKETTEQYEKIKKEHARIEEELEELNRRLDETKEAASRAGLGRQQLEGQIEVLKEQIHSVQQGGEQLEGRLKNIAADMKERQEAREKLAAEQAELAKQLEAATAVSTEADARLQELRARIEAENTAAETSKNSIISLLNERASTKGRLQRYDAMQEQAQIRRTELNQKLLLAKSSEEEQRGQYEGYRKELEEVSGRIIELSEIQREKEAEAESLRRELGKKNEELEIGQSAFHRESSRLESLRNMAERYDGYGNSIRKIMEQKKNVPGIEGVVADLIKVDQRYETAVETALGGSIQNIVTENEETAKRLIEYLKKNRFGRATFLPLTSVGGRGGFAKPEALKEKGAIGLASTLVRADKKYDRVVQHLLGRVLVAEHIDDAIRIARKYNHSIFIVTLEGESLSPGGSMTGGAFRNSSNLLGRKRELTELEENVQKLEADIREARLRIEALREQRRARRTEAESLNAELQQLYLNQNTAKMNSDQAKARLDEIIEGYSGLRKELSEIEKQFADIRDSREAIFREIRESEEQEKQNEARIEAAQIALTELKQKESAGISENERAHLNLAALTQKAGFVDENAARIERELTRLHAEEQEIQESMQKGDADIEAKKEGIGALQKQIEAMIAESERLSSETAELGGRREALLTGQKDFFTRREELSEKQTHLDKEVFRLNSQREKLEETADSLTDYMWEEYELTYNTALPMKKEEYTDLAALKKQTSVLKDEIRKLGDVNVNAIEDYKNISERYEFMNTQRNDLVKAEETLMGIIEELDTGMRRQFEEQFARIRVEFDKAFKELFGGGKGTLELDPDADMLEAGVRIIAQPPGKKLQNMMQLSGGEKALTAISLLFAIQNLKPSPFCLLDEIEAALDDSNVNRFAKYLHKLTKNTQFIIITHRKGTMESADRLYGITMQEKGVSTLVSVNLIEEELDE